MGRDSGVAGRHRQGSVGGQRPQAGGRRRLDVVLNDALGSGRAQLAAIPQLPRRQRRGNDSGNLPCLDAGADRDCCDPCVAGDVAADNVVLGAAFGFLLLNSLLVATNPGSHLLGLCIFLTLLVTATYLVSVRWHIVTSIRARQWRQLFTDLTG